MYNYSKIMDDCICIVHQCNSGNLSWVKLTLLFLQCIKSGYLLCNLGVARAADKSTDNESPLRYQCEVASLPLVEIVLL